MSLTSLLAGLTFLLDRFRIPLLSAMIGYILIMYNFGGVDHYFKLYKETAQDVKKENLPNIATATKARLEYNNTRVLTLICSSGGGIQAGAWTAKVLTGLTSEIPGFSESVFLISSASGGSVGAMYFLEGLGKSQIEREATSHTVPQSILDKVNEAATASSLEQIAWGLAYPDFARLLIPEFLLQLLPWFQDIKYYDRAWAMEQAWLEKIKTLGDDDVSSESLLFSDWIKKTRQGTLPAVAFNITIIETGELGVISTIDYPNTSATLHNRTLHEVYKTSTSGKQNDALIFDIEKVTAARLSASFPYVTPLSRADIFPKTYPLPINWHIGDGGYADNRGIVAVTEWGQTVALDDELRQIVNKKIDTILILRLEGFPESDTLKKGSKGWISAILGPVTGLLNVRSQTQISRGDLELNMLADLFHFVSNQNHSEANPAQLEVREIMLRIPTSKQLGHTEDRQPPLSWALSRQDQKYIEAGWQYLVDKKDGKVEEIRQVFSISP